MSYPQYDIKRKMYVCKVKKARIDNPAVKAGESYIWIKKDSFSQKEFFKNEEELNKKYPIPSFNEEYKKELKMLRAYRKLLRENINYPATKFLKEKMIL